MTLEPVSAARRVVDACVTRARCELCGWSGCSFRWAGADAKRRRGKCPRCGSLERHRLAYHVLRDRLPAGGRVLHIAPDRPLTEWLRGLAGQYVSTDLQRAADVRQDLTSLSFGDDAFDLVYCSHVLEHIPDDRTAMDEIARVLRPGGAAVIQVPVSGRATDEDPRVTGPMERQRRWGQSDHVRRYGMDLVSRLQAAGFTVEVFDSAMMERDTVTRLGLEYPSTRHVFLARLSRD